MNSFYITMKINSILILSALTIMLSSCGYTLQGRANLPSNIKSVSVSIFKNRSSIVSAEMLFTNAFIKELMRSSNVKVITDNKMADAVIYGTITSISFDALARTSDDIVYKRGINAVLNIEMKSRTGDIIFSVNKFTESESYDVTHQNSIDETAIKSTLEIVAYRLARRTVSQMIDNF
ncbi:MAG: hypothetical protein HQK63_00680 [Desulfamplus sp.]|nr:hypothetical protein [Desulfamplus sp.]